MKLLLAVHGYPPELCGGTEISVRELARGLARAGHEVTVVAGTLQRAKARGFAPMRFAEFEAEFAIEASDEGQAGVRVWVLEVGGNVKRSETNTLRIKFAANPDEPVIAKGLAEGGAPTPYPRARPGDAAGTPGPAPDDQG